MTYQCDRCGQHVQFYLEDGCEGPRDGRPEMFVVKDGPYRGQTRPWPKTASGRLVVPVPFVAAGCPSCQPTPPWSMKPGAGVLQHVHYHQDREFASLMLTAVPADAGVFLYPPDPRADQACGIPLLPGVQSRHGVTR